MSLLIYLLALFRDATRLKTHQNSKDHPNGYGGVFIACRNASSTFEIPLSNSDIQLVACQIQLADQSFTAFPPVIICT